jgi:hypothetical protein
LRETDRRGRVDDDWRKQPGLEGVEIGVERADRGRIIAAEREVIRPVGRHARIDIAPVPADLKTAGVALPST